MTRINTLKTSFSAGELSPRLAGRPDLAAYRDGARRLRNVTVHPTGGLSRRPGLAFVEAAPGPGRLAAFEFNTEESYLLLFTDRALRIYRAGAREASVAAPWRKADLAGLNWTQTADTLLVVHPDYPPQAVTRRAKGDWRIAPWEWAERAGRSMQPYHRYAAPSVTLAASAASGRVRLTASAGVFVSEDAGQPFRIGRDEVRIVRVVSATEAEADVTGALAGGKAATADWREPAFSARRGWPVSVVFHQDRLAIGGSRSLPDRLWLSRSGAFFDFDPGEGLDDEAIAFPLLADVEISSLYVTGGASANAEILRVFANVHNCPVHRFETTNSAALGAALRAAHAHQSSAGHASSWAEVVEPFAQPVAGSTIEPEPIAVAAYDELIGQYAALEKAHT